MNMLNELFLGDLGIQSNEIEEGFDEYITHDKVKYLLLTPIDQKEVLRDVAKAKEFSLKIRKEESCIYLSVYLDVSCFNGCNFSTSKSKFRLNNIFFEQIDDSVPKNHPETSDEIVSIRDFYDKLRKSHENDVLSSEIPLITLRENLAPILRKYQEKAIVWMLNRETVSRSSPATFVRLKLKNSDKIIFLNPKTLQYFLEAPDEILLPSGGILADEMGLGKTIEMLGLVLLNPKVTPFSDPRLMTEDVEMEESLAFLKFCELKCVCSSEKKKNVILCRKCKKYQHKKCVLKNTLGQNKVYICPGCWKDESLVESKTTFIVSPVSIKMQWLGEIQKHVTKKDFKIFVYDGITSSKWISPLDLAEYDVVLTDYNVLKTEIYFTNPCEKKLRYEKKVLNLTSPLPHVKWWRVCLDEAQMVEGITNNCTKMVKTLPTVHRWAVTGTPIEKSIDNLYGLIHFLDYEPYNEMSFWRELTAEYNRGNAEPLVQVANKIMWRSCKSNVMDQLGVPPQTEIVYLITMSDLQDFFYQEEHMKYEQQFKEKARRIEKSLCMKNMHMQTLSSIMEPLRKLRQDCSVPGILVTQRADNAIKKLLTPTELHAHLVSSNEIETKSQLRTLVSSLNGIAALHIIKEEYDEAIKYYKSVLSWADEYKGNICVDSLLQIHALANAVEIMKNRENNENEEIKSFEARSAALEWKYIESYYGPVKAIKLEINKISETIVEIEDRLGKLDGAWWRDVIYPFEKSPNNEYQFLMKLKTTMMNAGIQYEEMERVRTLDYYLYTWLQKVTNYRAKLLDSFQKIDYFANDLKPTHEMSLERREKIGVLIKNAFACHLEASFHSDDDDPDNLKEPPVKKQKNVFCKLCVIKSVLNEYECVIFQKSMDEGTKKTEGTWQQTPQEFIIKYIQTYAKNEAKKNKRSVVNQSSIEEGEECVRYLESLKAEFKEFSKYWVEINYTAASYDELNMCKSRLQVVTPEEYEQLPKKSINHILTYEVDSTLQDLMDQKYLAEKEFLRFKGTLKYLEYLNKQKDAQDEECPICRIAIEGKYIVLQCGHHLCLGCFNKLAKKDFVTCVYCRHAQKTLDIFYVSSKCSIWKDENVVVKGHHSNKIRKIVSTILRLKEADDLVKIIIFSHWEPILDVISKALTDNEITFRKKLTKFHQSVSEFKDISKNVTCLLLPLRFGSKGLNLTEATHVFLVEPILDPGEELQAVGRIHRIGQTKPTFVHRFIVKSTIEENIYNNVTANPEIWSSKKITLENLEALFKLNH